MMTHRHAAARQRALALSLVALTLLSATAEAQFSYKASATHRVNGEEIFGQRENSPAGINLPTIDATTDIQTFFDDRPSPRAGQLWTYADPTGAVRVSIDKSVAGFQFYENRQFSGIDAFPYHIAAVDWRREFIKTTQARRTSTVLPSKVELYSPLAFAEDPLSTIPEFQPFADFIFTITVCHLGPTIFEDRTQEDLVRETSCRMALSQIASLRGFTNFYSASGNPRFQLESIGAENGPISSSGAVTSGPGSSPGPIPFRIQRRDPLDYTVRLQYGRYVHELDVSWIPDGHAYSVAYNLFSRGGADSDQYMQVYLADPLSPEGPGSGIVTINADPPVMPGDLPTNSRQCDTTFDGDRFDVDGALVTDRYTGLTWQRCSIGTVFIDNDTIDDFTDDRCGLTATTTNNWQDALQSAAGDTTANLTDWRVPNVKELESLTASCAGAQIEPQVFPDTIANVAYWTSTPDARTRIAGISSWAVNFASGDINSKARTAALATRLVRDSGLTPVAPLPAISIGSAEVSEGDSGSRPLIFELELSDALPNEITVDYTATSPNNNAEANVDYTPVSGTVRFAPGERQQTIEVPVLGDTNVERNEILYVSLANQSPGMRLASLRGIGTIVDDEPVLAFDTPTTRIGEGDLAEQRVALVPVRLSRPAPVPVTVDFSLSDGTAVVGTDVVATAGTLTFATGEDLATISVTTIGDDLVENDESVVLTLANPVGAKLSSPLDGVLTEEVVVTDDDGRATYAALNDTGITECATTESGFLTCPQTGYPNQDADTGRDADPANSGSGLAGFTFVKRDATGVPLAQQFGSYFSTPWSCVEDTVTGLYWEVKTPNRSTFEENDLYSARWQYSWFNSTGVNDGGDPGDNNGGNCIDSDSCDIEKYVAAVNAEALCGFDDWRVPSVDEFFTIVNMRLNDWRLDVSYFPNLTLSSGSRGSAWTATPVPDMPTQAYYFNRNGASTLSKTFTYPVRLVRGGSQ